MLDFNRLVIPEVISGSGVHRLVGRSAVNLGARRVLLVTDPGLVAAGWAGAVRASLEQAGLDVVVFEGVTPNPRVDEVAAGARAYRDAGCNAIVVVGGGSPVDCAKGIGIVTANGGCIADYDGIDCVPHAIPPLVCVPTTAGTGADVSQFAIIRDPVRRTKFAVVSKAIVPDVSLLDPEPLTTQSRELTAATGLDALCHAVEAIGSTAASSLTTLLALEAARLMVAHLPRALAAPADLAERAGTMEGCFYAGLAFSNASLGAVHAMSHALGGFFDVPHGEANAALLPFVVEYNFPAAPERYRRLAATLGLALPAGDAGAAVALAGHLRGLVEAVGLGTPLRRFGVRAGDLAALADDAAEDPCMATNPRCPQPADLVRLYEQAL